jgi:Mg-chelatase subunit ChlD
MSYAYTTQAPRAANFQGYARQVHFVPPLRAVEPDLIGIVAIADSATLILPLVQITSPLALTAPMQLKPDGNTNLTAGFRMAHTKLRQLPKHIVRRVCVIADGEPNRENEAMISVVAAMRSDWIAIDSIFCGTSEAGAGVLRKISESTVGGHFHSATSYQALTDVVTAASARIHKRQCATVLIVDCSTSMEESMPGGGGTRISTAIKACQNMALVKRVAFNRVGAHA